MGRIRSFLFIQIRSQIIFERNRGFFCIINIKTIFTFFKLQIRFAADDGIVTKLIYKRRIEKNRIFFGRQYLKNLSCYLKVHVHIRYILPPGETVRRIVEAFYERSP